MRFPCCVAKGCLLFRRKLFDASSLTRQVVLGNFFFFSFGVGLNVESVFSVMQSFFFFFQITFFFRQKVKKLAGSLNFFTGQ